MTTVEAAESVGVSWPVGARWFRHAGGMPPLSLAEPAGRYLSFAERAEIALLRARDVGVRQIGRRLGRDPGTISRELRRNAAARSGKRVYRAVVAQWKAQQAAKRPKTAKLAGNDRLREYVQERLSEIGRRLGRDPGTISRELRRNAAARSGCRAASAGPTARSWPDRRRPRGRD
jgi:IS30 family transposase